MIRLVATLVAVLLLMGGPAHAQDLDPIELPRGNTHAQDFQKMRYLLVEPGPLDAETVLARKDEFQQVTSPWIDFGDQDGSVWVMMRVINPSDRAGEWMID
ncbi:MAG: 7TM-DISM domain-containing protein, partial [Pseudomonadota bacterium]